MHTVYKPEIICLQTIEGKNRYNSLVNTISNLNIIDTIKDQIIDLYKIKHPSKLLKQVDFEQIIQQEYGENLKEYGVWVYYPWSNNIVHLLAEKDFIAVRTNRNNLKITVQEQENLSTKSIGIIGLSVGHSIALTAAQERICNRLILADYDTLELSNLNRIRTSVYNLGLKKVIIAAREISEIDPFLEVEIYEDGIQNNNIDHFLGDEQKLNLLIEVCDGIDVKIQSRLYAKKYHIPVLMETNDKCMVDIERFDIETNRPIFHGLLDAFDLSNGIPDKDKMNLIMKLVEYDNLSERMKLSFLEIGKSIRSWPQLASSVTMGAGVTIDIARKILLNENIPSGRFYVDIDSIIN